MKRLAKVYRALPESVKTTAARLKFFKIYTWALRRRKKRFVKTTIDGIIYNLDLYTYVGSSMFNFGVYEKDTTEIMKRYLQDGMVAIDVGASIGAHTLRMAKLVSPHGKVYAFEPSENLYPMLVAGILENKFLNVTPERLALSSKSGTEVVDMTLLGNLDRSTPKEDKKSVQSMTIDEYVKIKGIERLDFIKIDTDGFEVEIIKGATETLKKFHPKMVVEFRKETAPLLVTLLKRVGYSFNYESYPHYPYSESDLVLLKKVLNVFCIYEQR